MIVVPDAAALVVSTTAANRQAARIATTRQYAQHKTIILMSPAPIDPTGGLSSYKCCYVTGRDVLGKLVSLSWFTGGLSGVSEQAQNHGRALATGK
jgi:hypothetical protein